MIPEVIELECMSIVKSIATKYATKGLDKCEKKFIIFGSPLNGSILEERMFKAKRIKPRKKIGLLIIFIFLPKKRETKPRIMRIGAIASDCIKASCAVIVVPILLPKITPRLLRKEMIPVFTSTTVNTVIAELDCIAAVENAPTNVPTNLFLTSFAIILLNLSAANSCISLLRFSIAKRKRISAEIKKRII